MRVGNELLQSVHIVDDPQLTPRGISQMYAQLKLKSEAESFERKPLHGYLNKEVSENSNIDLKLTGEWTTSKFMTSHFEDYACATTRQEIDTKDLGHRHGKLHQQTSTTDNKC